MTDNAPLVAVKDVCDIKPPKKEAKNLLNDQDLVSFVPMNSLGICEKNLGLDESKPLKDVYSGYTYFAENDVLLAKITPCFENGKLGIARNLCNKVGFGSSEYMVLRSKDNTDPEYLFYFLSQDKIREAGKKVMTGAVGHKRVPPEFIEELKIRLPSLPEQKRIVAILDEAFANISQSVANAEKNLANARELFDSYLGCVADHPKPLGEFVNIKTGKLDANAAVVDGEYPFFTCAREIYQIDHYAFDCEAILLAGNNASGDFNVKHYKGKFNAYQRTYIITVSDENLLLYRFLYYQMLKSLKELKESSVGAGTKFLKLGMIKNLNISVPPISKQQEVLDILELLSENISNLEEIYQRKLAALAELKQALLQKAFTGELTA